MTNLNEAFWRWFGNSTIRHEDGTPRIVYHGTRSPVEFDVFRTGSIFDEEEDELLISGSHDPSAFLGPHFTQSLKLAEKFAEGKAEGWDRSRYVHGSGKGRVIPVYLRIENPKVFRNDDEVWDFIWEHGTSHEIDDLLEFHEVDEQEPGRFYFPDDDEFLSTKEMNVRMFNETSDESESGRSARETAAEELGTSARDVLIKQGYDGIVYLNTVEGGGHSYVVFEANQIKSADRNAGTWDRENPSILSGPPEMVYVPLNEIVIDNEDVLAQVRYTVQQQINRGRYKNHEEWARAVYGSAESEDPVDLYPQKDGSLLLLDGNHRYFAATILQKPLPAKIVRF